MESTGLLELPAIFCWTRFGGEAAEPIEEILFRKEKERLANGGVFLWGIGNAIGPSILELMLHTARPTVIFSPIKTAAKLKDIDPPSVVVWTEAEALDGNDFTIPSCSRVTSRYDPESPKRHHFALVCYSASPLLPLRRDFKIGFQQLSNLRTGRPVAASQVTAVVQRKESYKDSSSLYDVAILAELIEPYFVRLKNAKAVKQARSPTKNA
ncbi:MAG: hypothetical protein JNL64_00135 [Blastocatellia bacterium]|nr:hypothetical protein [Blastocatellia bacterium]